MSEESQLPVPVVSSPSVCRTAWWRMPWFWVVLAVLVFGGWQWWELNSRLANTQQEVARRLAESDALVKESRTLATKSLEQVTDLQRKYGALEGRLVEFQGQASALQSLYQEGGATRDEALLAELEQGLNIASQQLQVAGNVQAAIMVLQGLDARLARLDRPQFLGIRKALLKDLERLRGTSFVDVAGMNLRLEHIMVGIDTLPLMLEPTMPDKSVSPVVVTQEDGSWWTAFLGETWRELKGLVRIQHFDRQEPVLLTSDQSLVLRENLKLRLLNARLALLSRDQWIFRNELKVASGWLERYFDMEDKTVLAAMAALKQLSATEITVDLPSLNDSLKTLQILKTSQEGH